jgi:hypothetical protein
MYAPNEVKTIPEPRIRRPIRLLVSGVLSNRFKAYGRSRNIAVANEIPKSMKSPKSNTITPIWDRVTTFNGVIT